MILGLGLAIGVCAVLAFLILSVPLIAGLAGFRAGQPAMLLAVMAMPWWATFVIGRLHSLKIFAVITGSDPVPEKAKTP